MSSKTRKKDLRDLLRWVNDSGDGHIGVHILEVLNVAVFDLGPIWIFVRPEDQVCVSLRKNSKGHREQNNKHHLILSTFSN